MVKVKICGVTSVAEALMAVEAGAAAIGLNFHPPSPRYLSPSEAERIASAVADTVCKIGVFVNAPRTEVSEIAERLGLNALQFHGDEDAEYCRNWKKPVIKAVRVTTADSIARAAHYPVDFILADAYVEGLAGGTGRIARWDWVTGVDRSRLILAGGLTPENVADAIRSVRPAAVDVASGVELAPGRKDPELVERFIANAKRA
jgi:phosphoribosylanthranilate isomerase